ncbi:hypothetical protein FACS189460_1310 [Deltaproteobacteria bacterium]|nr:hypothetical protein FACS189460_1310 [Deltaproteobacteria bacterium]
MSINVKWLDLLYKIAEDDEKLFAGKGIAISICIQKTIAEEVGRQIERSIDRDGMEHGNAAKIAGVTAFWIRKLKPLYVEPSGNPPRSYNLVNELVSLQVGVAICNEYFSDAGCRKIKVNRRVLKDWLNSFRYHSHSPHSSMISFEMLACEN